MNSFELDDLRSIGTPVDGKVPAGDPATAWPTRKLDYKLVSPLNRRKFTVIVVGTGLAGAACAASSVNWATTSSPSPSTMHPAVHTVSPRKEASTLLALEKWTTTVSPAS